MAGITFSLEGRRALVTGASSGLGPFIARQLDAAGASVGIHYHQNLAGAESLKATMNQPSTINKADLGNTTDVERLFQATIDAIGPVDILINCAAAESQDVEDLTSLTPARWAATQKANVEAPLVLSQQFAAQGIPGAIVNISSIEAHRPATGHSHYSTSKAALEMLTRASALELGHAGIRVNAIAPGLIAREGIEAGWPEGVNAWIEAAPLQRLVDPDNIASAVVFLVSDAAASITGTVLTIDCGLSTRSGW